MSTTTKTPIAARRVQTAVLLSSFGAGIGHVYAGRLRRGLLLFGLELLPIPLFFAFALLPASDGVLYAILGLCAFMIALYIYALISSGRAAAQAGTTYRLKPYNRPALYLLMALVAVGWSVGGVLLVRELAYEAYVIPTGSMAPAIQPGDRILVDKLAYKQLKRGDIVVFRSPGHPDRVWIKRLRALPGESLDVDGDQVVVPEGQVFVLGDNTANSHDSRHFGPIPMSSVIGVAQYLFWGADGLARAGRLR